MPCTVYSVQHLHLQVELDASELLAAVGGGGAPAAPDLALEAEGLVLDQVSGARSMYSMHLKHVHCTSINISQLKAFHKPE